MRMHETDEKHLGEMLHLLSKQSNQAD